MDTAMTSQIGALTTLFTEFYYWLVVVLMFMIHIGFVTYEVGASRAKNHMDTMLKNTMLMPVVAFSFYLFGWWIYFALVNGPGIANWFTDVNGNPLEGGLVAAPFATPWSELMGAHMGGQPVSENLTPADTAVWARLNGVFWAAFLLFSWTAASIVSGSVVERMRSGAFWIIAVLIGSVTWMIDAAWGWHPQGWMVKVLGYHDAYASGVIHAIAGGTTLAVLIVLGPRIGKFRADGTPRNINPHNRWLTSLGLFFIYMGFWGFYLACNVPVWDAQPGDGVFFSTVNIYLQPTSTSAITFNFLMSLSGGLAAGYIVSRGDAFWTYSCGLAGIIATSAGNDLYHPIQAMLIGAVVPAIIYKLHYWVERRFKLDDAVGGVAVHGYAGFLGVVIAGFMLWGYPSSPDPSFAKITPWGQFIGAVIMFWVLGFIPAYIVAWILKQFNLLRVPREVELVGLDFAQNSPADRDEAEMIQAVREEARASGFTR